MSSSSPYQSWQDILDKISCAFKLHTCVDRLTRWRAPWVSWLPTDHCLWPLGSEWCHSGGWSGKRKIKMGFGSCVWWPNLVSNAVHLIFLPRHASTDYSGIKQVFTDLTDDVHQSRVGGFRVAKWLDVEGSQKQRVRKLHQGQKETQNTRRTHPASREARIQNDLNFQCISLSSANLKNRIGNLCSLWNPKILFQT